MEKKKMMKYNPAFLTDEELIAGFVVRTKELESILTIIRENTSGSNQHILVEGPRGSGKTMLVRRVAAEIRRDESFNQKWYPILFAEESYMIQTPGEFWLDGRYLRDLLDVIGTDDVCITGTSASHPFTFRSAEDDGFVYVIMPQAGRSQG